jgi:hypothetical protein
VRQAAQGGAAIFKIGARGPNWATSAPRLRPPRPHRPHGRGHGLQHRRPSPAARTTPPSPWSEAAASASTLPHPDRPERHRQRPNRRLNAHHVRLAKHHEEKAHLCCQKNPDLGQPQSHVLAGSGSSGTRMKSSGIGGHLTEHTACSRASTSQQTPPAQIRRPWSPDQHHLDPAYSMKILVQIRRSSTEGRRSPRSGPASAARKPRTSAPPAGTRALGAIVVAFHIHTEPKLQRSTNAQKSLQALIKKQAATQPHLISSVSCKKK